VLGSGLALLSNQPAACGEQQWALSLTARQGSAHNNLFDLFVVLACWPCLLCLRQGAAD
jgi:hypothetical protein